MATPRQPKSQQIHSSSSVFEYGRGREPRQQAQVPGVDVLGVQITIRGVQRLWILRQ